MPLTTVDQGLLSANAQYTGFKNRLINGGMGIWQRGTSATLANYGYLADRWASGNFVSTQVSQSSSVPSGFQYSMKIQRAAGSVNTTAVATTQVIESNNCYDLSGQVATLSFWARAGANFSASGAALFVQLVTGTTADQGGNFPYFSWAGVGYGINTPVTLTTTWTRYSITSTTLNANILEMAAVFYFSPVGTAGADDSFFITGVQLEKGSTATSFDYRPYGTELALCQRYYWKIAGDNSDYPPVATGVIQATNNARTYIKHPVSMRTYPTFSYSGTLSVDNGGFVQSNVTSIAAAYEGLDTSMLDFGASAGGLTTGRGCVVYCVNASTNFLQASAEL